MTTFTCVAVLGWLSWTHRVYTEVVEASSALPASASVDTLRSLLLAASLALLVPSCIQWCASALRWAMGYRANRAHFFFKTVSQTPQDYEDSATRNAASRVCLRFSVKQCPAKAAKKAKQAEKRSRLAAAQPSIESNTPGPQASTPPATKQAKNATPVTACLSSHQRCTGPWHMYKVTAYAVRTIASGMSRVFASFRRGAGQAVMSAVPQFTCDRQVPEFECPALAPPANSKQGSFAGAPGDCLPAERKALPCGDCAAKGSFPSTDGATDLIPSAFEAVTFDQSTPAPRSAASSIYLPYSNSGHLSSRGSMESDVSNPITPVMVSSHDPILPHRKPRHASTHKPVSTLKAAVFSLFVYAAACGKSQKPADAQTPKHDTETQRCSYPGAIRRILSGFVAQVWEYDLPELQAAKNKVYNLYATVIEYLNHKLPTINPHDLDNPSVWTKVGTLETKDNCEVAVYSACVDGEVMEVVAKRYTGLHDWWLFKTFATEVLTHVDFGTDDPESRLLRAEAAHLDLAAGTAVLMLPKADGDLKNTTKAPLNCKLFLLRCLIDMCKGVLQLHAAGKVHCDVKPANVLYFSGEDGYLSCGAAMADYGNVTDAYSDVPRCFPGGTYIYAPPEINSLCVDTPLGHYDHRVDIYSLAMTTHVVLTGAYPMYWEGGDIASQDGLKQAALIAGGQVTYVIESSVDSELHDVLLRCLSPDMNDRPDSAHELLHALESVFDREEAAMEA